MSNLYTVFCLNDRVESLERATRTFNKELCRKDILGFLLYKRPSPQRRFDQLILSPLTVNNWVEMQVYQLFQIAKLDRYELLFWELTDERSGTIDNLHLEFPCDRSIEKKIISLF